MPSMEWARGGSPILHDSDAFGTGGMKAFTEALRNMYGIEPVMIEKFHAGDRDFTGPTARCKKRQCRLARGLQRP